MPKITLDALSNIGSDRNNTSVFNDLHLDLTLDTTLNDQLYKKQQITDIKSDSNLGAIYNSIANIIMTRPGQKPLNPIFGVGFGDLLFLPVTETRARAIGTAIYNAIKTFEPRVDIVSINVKTLPDDHQYLITMVINVPRFDAQQVQVVGLLDKTGFYLN